MVAWQKGRDGNVTFVANGKQYYVNVSDPRYPDVLNALRNSLDTNSSKLEDELVQIVDQTSKVQDYFATFSFGVEGSISIENGTIVYTDPNGDKEECHNTVVDKILQFIDQELPIQPLVKFLHKIMQNPSSQTCRELYDFLEHKSLPICEDGDFLAYKAVTSNYLDKYSGTVSNSVGSVVSLNRRKVNDDRNHGCSHGLHAGTLDYVNGYGKFVKDSDGNVLPESDKVVIVKINPKNVVSVPLDCECQKLRCCEYYVLKDFDGELKYQLADNQGLPWEQQEFPDYDDEDYSEYDWRFVN